MQLTIRDDLPPGFLDAEARDLWRLFDGPALIRLPGRRMPALFVSVLLHGNEVSGLQGVQQVLRRRLAHGLPRGLLLMVGNVAAAREGLRRLDGQPDYNRVWPGAPADGHSPEAAAMAQAHALIRREGAFAAIDLHNNTGLNPHYGVLCSLDPRSLYLATLFSRTAVWFRGVPGTQTASLAGMLPAIAAECGQPGAPANAAAAARVVEAALDLAEFPAHPVRHQDIDLFHSLAVVKVREEATMSFAGEPADLRFDPALDHFNFRELAAGTVLGRTDHAMPLVAVDEDGRDVTARFLAAGEGTVRLRQAAMPAMLTRDARIVRQDCLCYLMERVPPALLPPGAIA